jgi:hypothetical protein
MKRYTMTQLLEEVAEGSNLGVLIIHCEHVLLFVICVQDKPTNKRKNKYNNNNNTVNNNNKPLRGDSRGDLASP